MNVAVRYYTKTGNTKRLAEAVAEALGVKAYPISEPIREKTDILFLGNSYYAFSIDPEVRNFVRGLDKNLVGKIVRLIRRSRLRQIRPAFRWMEENSTARANSRASIRANRMRMTSRQRQISQNRSSAD